MIPTEPYKGVRDFYPEDMRRERYILDVFRKTAESFGYSEYSASILEPSALYEKKTSQEIVSEQTYTFKDRGDRMVTLRPEMTPTTARMVAARVKTLGMPLRWYSVPNIFRYESPQRGRLREHFQLNVDLFGIAGVEADTEIISMASAVLRNFGAKDSDFIIKINNRKILNELYQIFNLSEDQSKKLSIVLDKREKMEKEDFEDAVNLIVGPKGSEFLTMIHSNPEIISKLSEDHPGIKEVVGLIELLDGVGITNIVFDPSLIRGFDYYSGTIFEIFDTDKDNRRSLAGGGRYDELLELFGEKNVPAVGFGLGDVVLNDFLLTHELFPNPPSLINVYICPVGKIDMQSAKRIADNLRRAQFNVLVDISGKNVSDQIRTANKLEAEFVICIGENEIKGGQFKIKMLKTGEEFLATADNLIKTLADKSSAGSAGRS